MILLLVCFLCILIDPTCRTTSSADLRLRHSPELTEMSSDGSGAVQGRGHVARIIRTSAPFNS